MFTAPGAGEVVVTETEYTLTWDTQLLKYFVDGDGAEPGSDRVSENVTIYLVGSAEDEGGKAIELTTLLPTLQ